MLAWSTRATSREEAFACGEVVSSTPDSAAADIAGRPWQSPVGYHLPTPAVRDSEVGVDVGAVDETLARIERCGSIGHD